MENDKLLHELFRSVPIFQPKTLTFFVFCFGHQNSFIKSHIISNEEESIAGRVIFSPPKKEMLVKKTMHFVCQNFLQWDRSNKVHSVGPVHCH